MSLINHAPVRDVPCRADPRLRATMNMHYSGSLNGFWARHNVMRPGPMALAGPGLVLGKKVGPVDCNVKLEFKAQGPNRSGGPVSYNSY